MFNQAFVCHFALLGEQQDAVDNLITAMDLTDAQRWVIFGWYKMVSAAYLRFIWLQCNP